MLKDPNKLYSYIAIATFFVLILVLFILRLAFDSNGQIPPWITFTESILTNLISSLIIILILFFLFKKKFFQDNEIIPDPQSLKTIQTTIKEETNEIDESIKSLKSVINRALIKRAPNLSSWSDFINVLSNLRGYWIEYIPQREIDGCEFSIGNFHLDDEAKHEFNGNNYFTNNIGVNYSWETKKVLAPIRLDSKTIAIYYIYHRKNNTEFNGKFGFGKLIAIRESYEDGEKDNYSFIEGFFFNEATRDDGYYLMRLRRLSEVANMISIKIHGKEEDPETLLKLFKALKETNLHKKW